MDGPTGEDGDPVAPPTRTLFYGLFPRPADLAAFDERRRDAREEEEPSSAGSYLEIV